MPAEASTDLAAFLQHIELSRIDYLRLEAENSRLADVPDGGADADVEVSHGLHIEFRKDDTAFRVRFSTSITPVEGGRVVVEVGGEWECAAPASELDHVLLEEFVNGVALMVLFPYVREAVADLTRRVYGSALLMPVVQRGQVTFSLDGSVASS